MKYLKALLVGLALLAVSCASTSVYDGPVGKVPVVSVEYYRHVDSVSQPLFPHWTRNTILNVSNPSYQQMAVRVECDGTSLSSGTSMRLDIAARTTQQLLLLPEDGSCVVTAE